MSEFIGGDPLAFADDFAPVPEPARPMLRVVKGYPSDDELAAVVAVLATIAGGAERTPREVGPTPAWANPGRSMRHHFRPVPGHLRSDSWWQSGMPS